MAERGPQNEKQQRIWAEYEISENPIADNCTRSDK